jgi:hypothetical protein
VPYVTVEWNFTTNRRIIMDTLHRSFSRDLTVDHDEGGDILHSSFRRNLTVYYGAGGYTLIFEDWSGAQYPEKVEKQELLDLLWERRIAPEVHPRGCLYY